jgi:transcription elongation factor GreA
MAGEIYLTREGYNKLIDELERLKKRKPELSAEIGRARELGDLKENAEYHAAKEALGHLATRIAEIENKIAKAKLIDEQNIDPDKVFIGATVALKDLDSMDEFEYTIVDVEEANPSEGKISVNSPMAQGLLGHTKGETVMVKLPKTNLELEILNVFRK